MRFFIGLIVAGLVVVLSTGTEAAPSKKGGAKTAKTAKTSKSGEHRHQGTIVKVSSHSITIRTHHHHAKTGKKATTAKTTAKKTAAAKKGTARKSSGSKSHSGHSETFSITKSTKISGGTGRSGQHRLHKGENVSILAHAHHADRISILHHHHKSKTKTKRT